MSMAQTLKKLTIDNSLSNIVNIALWWLDCGHYLENLNKETINLSLYALEIKNVVVKQSALSKMNLPIQVVFGKLEYAKVMAPWTELLKWKDTDRTLTKAEVLVDGLYLLVRPNNQVKYNREKEEKEAYDAKKAKLQSYENDKNKRAEPQSPDGKPSFAWNIVSKILKNLRITVKNIHIRYEDSLAPSPYALGLTMACLDIETTDETWKPAVLGNADTKTYKLATLDCLSFYLNSSPEFYSTMIDNYEALLDRFKDDIAAANELPFGYMYILEPMSAQARVTLNLNSSTDNPPFSVPILQVDLNIDKLNIELMRCQYQSIIHLVEGLGVQAKGVQHRHFRPNVNSYKGHYKKWWIFAYNCVAKDNRRKRLAWDWNHIYEYRKSCKAYSELFKTQLMTRKLSKDQQREFEKMEQIIDVLTLFIIREKVRIEVERTKSSESWFGGFFTRTDKIRDDDKSKTMMNMIANSMTPADKEQLNNLIKNMDKKPTINYPPDYVDVVANIFLKTLIINLSNETKGLDSVIKIKLRDTSSVFSRRPLEDGIKLLLSMRRLTIRGTPTNDISPYLMSSKMLEDWNFLEVHFELNPLETHYGQRIYCAICPSRVIFNVKTINELVELLSLPKEHDKYTLEIPEVTTEAMTDLRKMTVSGLKYVIEKHTLMDVDLHISAPFIIFPENVMYKSSGNAILLNLGSLMVKSKDRKLDVAKVNELYKERGQKEEIKKILLTQVYDTFTFQAKNIQVLIIEGDEYFESYIFSEPKSSPMHLLNPMDINVTVDVCLISDDPNLPILKVSGDIPMIWLSVVEERMLLLMRVALALDKEFKKYNKPTFEKKKKMDIYASPVGGMFLMAERKDKANAAKKSFKQLTNVTLNFVLKEMKIMMSSQLTLQSPIFDILQFQMSTITVFLIQQTFNTNINICLDSIALKHNLFRNWTNLISTTNDNIETECLFSIKIDQVNSKSPEFSTKYDSCGISIAVNFGVFKVRLVQECLIDLLGFKDHIIHLISERDLTFSSDKDDEDDTVDLPVNESSILDTSILPYVEITDTTSLKLTFSLKEIALHLISEDETITKMSVGNFSSKVQMKQAFIKINAMLGYISVIDFNSKTYYRNIVYIDKNETAFLADVTLFDLEIMPDAVDIDVKVRLGKVKICFVTRFIKDLLTFANKFQKAEKAIAKASANAAGTAKENINEIYEKAKKIKLDIGINAPKIIIPEGSKRICGLAFDLGHISIKNKSITLTIKNSAGHFAVIDEIALKLENLRLDKVRIDSDLNDFNQMVMLEPLTVTILVYRKLTLWYKAVPDLDVMVTVNDVEFKMGQSEYVTIINIASINLNEGAEMENEVDDMEVPEKLNETKVRNKTLRENTKLEKSGDTREGDSHEINIICRWNFCMPTFKIFLYSTYVMVPVNFIQRIPCPTYERVGLSEISIEGLYIRGRILSNESIVNDLILVNFHLMDRRPEKRNTINCYMTRRKADDPDHPNDTIKHMLEITFQQQCGDMFIEVRVCKFMFILSIDFLIQVANFFNVTTETSAKKEIPKKPPRPQKKPEGNTQRTQRTQRISVAFKIEKPYLVLVEDMNTLETRCLMLNFKMLLKVRLWKSETNINGGLTNIQMYTCMFDPRDREATKKMLLEPFSINVTGLTNQPGGLCVEVLISDIHICIALYTIELIMNVLKTLSSNNQIVLNVEEKFQDFSRIWNFKNNSESTFWFLKEKAEESYENPVHEFADELKEICMISIRSIVITIEAGAGNRTLPMLVMYSHLDAGISDWSNKLKMEAVISLQMGYYNNILALWEPIVEPIATSTEYGFQFKPWEILIEVSQQNQTSEDSENQSNQPAAMMVDLTSSHNLEVTITKTCIEVLNNLGNLFSAATSYKRLDRIEILTPFKIVNVTGMYVEVLLINSDFRTVNKGRNKIIKIHSGQELSLDLMEAAPNVKLQFLENREMNVTERNIDIIIPRTDDKLQLNLTNANTKYYGLKNSWGLISTVNMDNGITIITLSSNLQIFNDFAIPVDIYYTLKSGNEIERISTIESGHSIYIPMKIVNSEQGELFFNFQGELASFVPYTWRNIKIGKPDTQTIVCSNDDLDLSNEFIVIRAIGEMKEVTNGNADQHTMSSVFYTIHLKPSVILKNCLPVMLTVCLLDIKNETDIPPGTHHVFLNINPGVSVIVLRYTYLERNWSCKYGIPEHPSEFAMWTFKNYVGTEVTLFNLGMHTAEKKGTFVMTLYCPFWMVNKTGRLLSYQKWNKPDDPGTCKLTGCKITSCKITFKREEQNLNIMQHPSIINPLMISFDEDHFFARNKIFVRLDNGEWSKQFSLDTAGSSGVISSKLNDVNYQISVHNKLTHNSLTKKITFTPYLLLINHSSIAIEFYELSIENEDWIKIPPKSCKGMWPKQNNEQLIKFRIHQTVETTTVISISDVRPVLLKLENKFGGLFVDTQATEGAISMNLSLYNEGMAPAIIVNDTSLVMYVREKGSNNQWRLQSKNNVLFTWNDPMISRVLVWSCGYYDEIETDLRIDNMKVYFSSGEESILWITFLDGLQRVLLVTDKPMLLRNIEVAKDFDKVNMDVAISIRGFGLSLVNNWKRQEIAYFSITSSGVVWEACKENSKKFRPLKPVQIQHLENGYQAHIMSSEEDNADYRDEIERMTKVGEMHVNFDTMVMVKPHRRQIRRVAEPGIWLNLRAGEHLQQLHVKINKLQIDNQLYDCVFPVLLALVNGEQIKPFIEVSIVELLTKNRQIKQYKYFKILIQEFQLKIELGFLSALVGMVDNLEFAENNLDWKDKFYADIAIAVDPLYKHISMYSLQDVKSFFDYLHISPLKIHLSFSLSSSDGVEYVPPFLNVLLQSMGAPWANINDVIFKLDFFEREYCFLTQRQLIMEAVTHYANSFVKQIHVLVFGLEVLGNPYTLMVRLSKGLENLFYEPYQGAVQGPAEFAEGLKRGFTSFFKHAVGGAAGALSKITGAVGTGVTALTMDEEYQRKRRSEMRSKPDTVKEGLVRGGTSLAWGVVGGVTGIVQKPFEGAKKKGVEGFFKGLGKGTVGFVTRPTAGLMDFTTAVFQSIGRMTDKRKEHAKRIRAPRFVHADCHVRPYNLNLAEGNKLLCEAEKSKYLNDLYSEHIILVPKKEILMFSDKRLLFLEWNTTKQKWKTEWMYTWSELKTNPAVIDKGVRIYAEHKKDNPFSFDDNGKVLTIKDQSLCEIVADKIIDHIQMNL